jgi:beta-N-acetylhexosaminidase
VVGGTEHRALADELAERSITRIRDRDGLIPVRLAADARILVIEPQPSNLTPADTSALLSRGGLAGPIRDRNPNVESIVVGDAIEDAEIARILGLALVADLTILGTVDVLGRPSIVELARALAAGGRPVVAVALRGPWDADAYPEVGTVLATYGIQSPSLAALVAALWADAPLTGRLPVRLARA